MAKPLSLDASLENRYCFQRYLNQLTYGSNRQRQHALQMLTSAIRSELTAKQRSVVELHYFQHLSFTEIARMQNTTKSSVCRLHQRAIERLERVLRYAWPAWLPEFSGSPSAVG